MSEVRTEVKIESRIDKSTEKDATRYALGHVLVTPATDESVWLSATNSRILAIVEAEGTTDEERLIPSAVLPTRKAGSTVRLNGQWESSDGKFCPVESEPGRFPRMESVIPQVQNDYFATVRLNAKYLMNLVDSIGQIEHHGSEGITLLIPQPNKDGEIVDAVSVLGRLGIGVIMPVNHSREADREQYIDVSKRYTAAREAVK